jgi:hypothetical protein
MCFLLVINDETYFSCDVFGYTGMPVVAPFLPSFQWRSSSFRIVPHIANRINHFSPTYLPGVCVCTNLVQLLLPLYIQWGVKCSFQCVQSLLNNNTGRIPLPHHNIHNLTYILISHPITAGLFALLGCSTSAA